MSSVPTPKLHRKVVAFGIPDIDNFSNYLRAVSCVSGEWDRVGHLKCHRLFETPQNRFYQSARLIF